MGEREGTVLPEPVMDAVKRSLVNVEELRGNMLQFLAISEPDVLAEMHPLKRAHALLLLAKATSTLFALRLRCSGVHPDDHPVKTELERISLYQEKLERFMDLNKAPLRPSTTLNYQAATRFIEHSLPDLTAEQKQNMRDISRGGEKSNPSENRNTRKKRKYHSSEKQSVRVAAQEFLEKAARELLVANNGDVRGPLRIENSDEEDIVMG